jgi:1D-myo-inositol-tetrakisphosphate 5-kinase/inositol-polyphosphate multikinase
VKFTKAQGKALKVTDLPDVFSRFFPVSAEPPTISQPPSTQTKTPSEDCGLPPSIRAEITKIRDVYSSIEMRMVGSSFLIVYEADWARAAEGVERVKKEEAWESGMIDGEQDEEEEEGEDGYDEGDDEDDDEEKNTIPFVVKLIDFAHTHITHGQGPDEGVLQGMNKVLELIEERIDTLEKDQSAPS